MKFVSDLWTISGFSPVSLVFSTNKTNLRDITVILLKVALNAITLTLNYFLNYTWVLTGLKPQVEDRGGLSLRVGLLSSYNRENFVMDNSG
jgi:hypothetical protein